jgi:hypothetical protein
MTEPRHHLGNDRPRTASLLAAVSFVVTVSSHESVSGSSGLASLIHIRILIPIIVIQDPIGAIKIRVDGKMFATGTSEGMLQDIAEGTVGDTTPSTRDNAIEEPFPA